MDRTKALELLTQMRENCVPKDGDAYDDPLRKEKLTALNYVIDLISIPTVEVVTMVDEDHFAVVEDDCVEIYSKTEFYATPTPKNEKTGE